MPDAHVHQARFVVETVEDPLSSVVAPVLPARESIERPRAGVPNPGEIRAALRSKLAVPITPSPVIKEPIVASSASVLHHDSEQLLDFGALFTICRDRLNTQLVSMSVPVLVALVLITSVVSFFAGRLSSLASKQAQAAENPLVTPVPASSLSQTPVPTAIGTPDDILKAAQSELASDVIISKKPDATASEKDTVSQSIVHILDNLTKGITAYPDVAALYFQRAQVEKMVMTSAPTLNAQAAADYQKALSLSPLSAAYYIGFADYFAVTGNSVSAVANYEKAVKLEPKNLDALYPLAKLDAAAGETQAARQLYAQILGLLPSASTQYAQIQQESEALAAPAATTSATITTP